MNSAGPTQHRPTAQQPPSSLVGSLVEGALQHIYVVYLAPLFAVALFFVAQSPHVCLDDRLQHHPHPFFNFQTATTCCALLVMAMTSLRFHASAPATTTVNVSFSVVLLSLHAFLFHSFSYNVIKFIRSFLNDTACSPKGKMNGISGHAFTMVFFFAVLLRLVSLLSWTPRAARLVSFEHPPLPRTAPFFTRRLFGRLNRVTPPAVISFVLLAGFVVTSYCCLSQTLFNGYHTPFQFLLGLVAGVVVVELFALFQALPLLPQSAALLLLHAASTVLLFASGMSPAPFDVFTAICVVVVVLNALRWALAR